MPLNLNLISYLKSQRLNLKKLGDKHQKILQTGHGPEWTQALDAIQPKSISDMEIIDGVVKVNKTGGFSEPEEKELLDTLQSLKPWRKGPFQIGDVKVDSEWNSSLKWKRLEPYFPELRDKRILDIGCNSGYYMFRMT